MFLLDSAAAVLGGLLSVLSVSDCGFQFSALKHDILLLFFKCFRTFCSSKCNLSKKKEHRVTAFLPFEPESSYFHTLLSNCSSV